MARGEIKALNLDMFELRLEKRRVFLLYSNFFQAKMFNYWPKLKKNQKCSKLECYVSRLSLRLHVEYLQLSLLVEVNLSNVLWITQVNKNKEVMMNGIETPTSTTQSIRQEQGLQDLVYSLVTQFLSEKKSKSIDDLYEMILSEVEPPLLKAVMEKKRGNQLQAAKMLGISRGTIRKKLQKYFGTKYFRLTDE